MKTGHWVCGLVCGGVLGVFACVEQPQGYCQIAQQQGQAHFAVYTDITPMKEGACAAKKLTAERIGFETYQLPMQDKINIAWRTETLQQRFEEASKASHWSAEEEQEVSLTLNVLGEYSSKPDAENRCYALNNGSNLDDPLLVEFSKTFEAAGTLPATTYTYGWRNVVVYSMPASPGQLVEGEVTYSIQEEGASEVCTGKYHFVALWPAYKCKSDEDCTPSVRGQEGSPINPDFAGFLKCHEKGYCTVTLPPKELIEKLSK
ncbi:MAG: hypothetical protein FWC28_07080 [Proteobacteria bacterium]|nr:hypothetical protein [Cystobacterineae bacterium]MCL2258703.1 hypothetical protein [Cystobacterineae bacterium]MCL2314993.1 hypothetical protein [Pseudomonadota bacterium]